MNEIHNFAAKYTVRTMTNLWTGLYLVLTFASLAQGQTYDSSWSTIDGGGGKSSGGSYTVFATVGQPDAGYASGDDYEVSGGFWGPGPWGIVNFVDFRKFADRWLDAPCNAGNDWCNGADLNHLNDVDWADVDVIADYWLYYQPLDWPLK